MPGLIEIGGFSGSREEVKIPYVKLTNGQTTENF